MGQGSNGRPRSGGAARTRPVPSPACLHRPTRSVPPPPSCWCATPLPPPERPPGPCSRSSWCGATSSRTSSAGPTSSPAGRSTWPTAGPKPRPCAPGAATPRPVPCSASPRAGWPTGWRSCARPSRRPASCWPGGRTAPLCWPGPPARRPDFAAARLRVNDGSLRFLDLCRDEGLRLSVGQDPLLRPLDHPARRSPPLRHPVLRGRRPARAARRPRCRRDDRRGVDHPRGGAGPSPAGDIEIIFPTIRNLQAISRFSTSTALLDTAAEASSAVPAIEPRVVADGTGMRIVLPGDAGYERGPVADPGDGGRWATSTRPCAPSRCRPTWRDPTPHRGPDRQEPDRQNPTNGDPGRAGLRARPGTGAGPAGRGGTRAAPAHRPESRVDDRAGHQHLSGRAGRPVVVDPGPADATHTAAIAAAAAPLGSDPHHRGHPHPPRPRAGRRRAGRGDRARVVGFGPAEDFAPDERVGEGWTLRCPAAPGSISRCVPCTRRATRRDHLCWLIEEHALAPHGRPRHARLDRRHPAARRGPAPVSGQPGPGPGRAPGGAHARSGPRPAHGSRARGDRRADRPPAGPSRAGGRRAVTAQRGHGRRVARPRSTAT